MRNLLFFLLAVYFIFLFVESYRGFVSSLMSFTVMVISQDHRSISRFIGYALCAADEALKDANWVPYEQEQKERTVSIFSM